MKLKQFDINNSSKIRVGEATVRMNIDPGTIAFSKRAAELIELNKGDKVLIFQDEENPKDWYVAKTDAGIGFACRTYSGGKQIIINNAMSIHRIFESIEYKEKSACFRLALQPTEFEDKELFAIITHKPLK